MRRVVLLILSSLLYSCSHKLHHQADSTPSWVEGVRSGEESLRVVNGSRILYRRIVRQQDESSDETCARVLKLVQEDVANESVEGVTLPYTLEYLFFEPTSKECAVTISIGAELLSKVSAIKSMKEKYDLEKKEVIKRYEEELSQRKMLEANIKDLQTFILRNKNLVDKYMHLSNEVEIIRRSISANRERVRNSFLTGMSIRQFQRATAQSPRIGVYGENLCFYQFNTVKSSPHGNIHVCWHGGYGKESVAGICDVRSGKCFNRDP